MTETKKVLVLFDIDGTLTPSRKTLTEDMDNFITELQTKVDVGVVGGSDLPKQKEQLGENATTRFKYSFSENGVIAFEEGKLISKSSITDKLGEEKLQKFLNFCLHYIADFELPVKRGTFIEFRNGMINISLIGRNCSYEERLQYVELEKEGQFRQKFVKILQEKFSEYGLVFSIGGQISIDVFPQGWSKEYCLQFVNNKGYDEIHFFGDKTYKGGNDYEIFIHEETIGHTVTCPEDTVKICKELFF
ncbi:phosphomannomutase-related [Anaeramoeba flamelloides]|uniref:Phosphomannomutase n=1 Tax=Anaeramoeba flamelloides TaxID=1746091 RepID=A0AAV7ZL49_9EUKA|nr:phosphomannomutase-related [Anaeramoeba flamelloides]